MQGNATAERNGENRVLKTNDEIFKGDTLKTSANSALGVIFDDETTFNLRANASITIDDFVYQEGSDKNDAAIAVLAGTVAFVASAVARTGDMTIATPVSTLGIRGTTGLVEVRPSGSGTITDNIKLYPDADGHVGRIEIRGHDGTALGVLTRGASGFAIRGGAGVRATAAALRISPEQAARDQTIVRQTHQAQSSRTHHCATAASSASPARRLATTTSAAIPDAAEATTIAAATAPDPTAATATTASRNRPNAARGLTSQIRTCRGKTCATRRRRVPGPQQLQQICRLHRRSHSCARRSPSVRVFSQPRVGPAQRLVVPPGRKPAPAQAQKKPKPKPQ